MNYLPISTSFASLSPPLRRLDCETSPGHWPLETTVYCHTPSISLQILNETIQIFSHSPHIPSDLVHSWNIIPDIDHSPSCAVTFDNVLFLPIPYDPSGYQSDGSNYYVIHVDILLPLWNYLRGKLSPPTIVIFPFNKHLQREMSSEYLLKAFQDSNKYWIHSIQLSSHHQLIPGTGKGIRLSLQRASSSPTEVYLHHLISRHSTRFCFQNIQIGLPRYDRPSPISLKKFSQLYREVSEKRFPSPAYTQLTVT